MKKIIVTCATLAIFTGCQENEPALPEEPRDLYSAMMTGAETHGRLQLMTTGRGPQLPGNSYQYSAEIHDSPNQELGTPIDGGTLTIGDLRIEAGGSTYFHQEVDGANADNTGQEIAWGLGGNPQNGTPTFTTSMYMPANISLSVHAPGDRVSKRNGITCKWNPDPNHPGKTYIWLRYNIGGSQLEDSSLPTTRWSVVKEVDDSAGSYNFSSSDLAGMPWGYHRRINWQRQRQSIPTYFFRSLL